MSKVVDVIEGKTFNIDKLGDDCYVFDFHQHRIHIWLDEEEMRDIADTFTKSVFNGLFVEWMNDTNKMKINGN